jgi:hypothetical protein
MSEDREEIKRLAACRRKAKEDIISALQNFGAVTGWRYVPNFVNVKTAHAFDKTGTPVYFQVYHVSIKDQYK